MFEFEDQFCCFVSRNWVNNLLVKVSGNLEVFEDKRKCEDSDSFVIKKMRFEFGILDGVVYYQSFGNQESSLDSLSVSRCNFIIEELVIVIGMVFSGVKVVDVYRTGVKCVFGEVGDSGKFGVVYYQVGLFRVKLGRGDRIFFMFCSDKLVRWNVFGC